jgi:hypothetical protein
MTPLIVTLVLAGAVSPQMSKCDSTDALSSVPIFVECARAATARYRDRAVAIRDGYRRVGRDFPAMGEHWIRISLVFDGRFDPSHPEVLNYVDIGGEPQLVGVGYAVPLLAGEAAPEGPAGPHAWHDHFRTVDDETLLPQHQTRGSANDGPRLAMMHAWIWSHNPEGLFAADNWAIPLLRLNLTPPAEFSLPAAKALSLLGGGREYVQASILAANIGGDQPASVRAALDEAVQHVTAIVGAHHHAELEPSDAGRLANIWTELWKSIDGTVPADVAEKLAALAIR